MRNMCVHFKDLSTRSKNLRSGIFITTCMHTHTHTHTHTQTNNKILSYRQKQLCVFIDTYITRTVTCVETDSLWNSLMISYNGNACRNDKKKNSIQINHRISAFVNGGT